MYDIIGVIDQYGYFNHEIIILILLLILLCFRYDWNYFRSLRSTRLSFFTQQSIR